MVALGHDLIEDTDITEYEFVHKYKLPQFVWDKIEILSREDGESYKEYIDCLIENKDKTILFVKMEDLKHNMDLSRLKTVTEEDIERNKKYEKHFKRIVKAYKELQ